MKKIQLIVILMGALIILAGISGCPSNKGNVSPEIKKEDIINWQGLIKSLKEHNSIPRKRVWDYLPQESKDIINSSKEGEDIDDGSKSKIVEGLNKVLESDDLYNPDEMKNLIKSKRGMKLVEKGVNKLKKSEKMELNRILIEAIFKDEIARIMLTGPSNKKKRMNIDDICKHLSPEQKRFNSKITGKKQLYLQGTASMIGFASKPNTSYIKCLRILKTILDMDTEFLLYGDQRRYEVRTISLEQASKVLKKKDKNNWDKGIYTYGRNDVSGVLEKINDMPEDKRPDEFILITSGVNNAKGFRKERQVIKEILNLIEKGYCFDIIAIESAFTGPVWSIQYAYELETETNSTRKDGYLGEYKNKTRPFYLLIFSKNRDFGKELYGRLKNDYKIDAYHFQTVSDGSCVKIENLDKLTRNIKRYSAKKENLEKGRVFLKWSGNGEKEATFNIRSNNTKYKKNDIIVDWFSLTTARPVRKGDVKLTAKKDKDGNPGLLEVKVTRPDPIPNEGCICRIRIYPEVPEWIDELSSDSDRKLSDFGKTLYFKEMIREIIKDDCYRKFPYKHFYIILKR